MRRNQVPVPSKAAMLARRMGARRNYRQAHNATSIPVRPGSWEVERWTKQSGFMAERLNTKTGRIEETWIAFTVHNVLLVHVRTGYPELWTRIQQPPPKDPADYEGVQVCRKHNPKKPDPLCPQCELCTTQTTWGKVETRNVPKRIRIRVQRRATQNCEYTATYETADLINWETVTVRESLTDAEFRRMCKQRRIELD